MENELLLRILKIGHDASMRGEGISLRDALERADYRNLRPRFDASDLIPIIREHPELIQEWLMYSEDKRTSGGFALENESAAGVADYVVRELDFWESLK
jgi:hypothetical protein